MVSRCSPIWRGGQQRIANKIMEENKEDFSSAVNQEKAASEDENFVIEQNLKKMLDEMAIFLTNEESIGGTGGSEEIEGQCYSCATANCLVNAQTGKIIEFSNESGRPSCSFRIAFDNQFSFFKIINTYCSFGVNSEAAKILEKCSDKWNEIKAAEKAAFEQEKSGSI